MTAITLVEQEVFRPGLAAQALYSHGLTGEGFPWPVPQPLESSDVLRASDVGYRSRSADTGGVQPYPPLLRSALSIDRQINLSLGASNAAAAWGGLTLSNADGRFDSLAGTYNSDRRAVRVLRGQRTWDAARQLWLDPPRSSMSLVFAGLSRPWFLGDEGLTIEVRDATYWLERPLLSRLYLGTGAYEGTADMAGQPVPKVRGGLLGNPVNNVTPVLVDPSVLLYQVSDGPGGINFVYTGGDFSNMTRAPAVSDPYATTCPPGQFRVISIPTGLYLQLGSPLSNGWQLTCDAYGHFPAAGAVSQTADVVRYLLTEEVGLPAEYLDLDSFAGAQASFPSISGDYWPQPVSAIDAIAPFLAGMGAQLVPTRDGRLRLAYIASLPSSPPITATFDSTDIVSIRPRQLPADLAPPPGRIRVSYQRNNTLQTNNLDPDVTPTRQQYLAQEYRTATYVSTPIQQSYRTAGDPPAIATRLLSQTNAQALTNRLALMWCAYRRLYDMVVPIDRALGVDLGTVVRITYPRGGFQSGLNGVVVGESIRGGETTSTLTVLI
jgi:hypothetical protein